MNQPEHELARRIVQHLDHGVDQLGSGVRERLLVARKAALAQYREQPATGLAWAGQAVARFTESGTGIRSLIAVSTLAVVLASVVYWQNQNNNGTSTELADIDTGLLTGELPLNAYLDKGFDSWLKRSSR
jgi:hypothetical protein